MDSMLSQRQVVVQRDNLAAICRISVKCLLDYASLHTHVNDDNEEFINFCAVLEQLVSHRMKPVQKKTWLSGQGSPRHFWDVLLDNHHRTRSFLYESCIPNIEAIESIKSPKAKLRAFIRVALMEKRLSDYLYWVIENKYLLRDSYHDGAFLTSDAAPVLIGDLVGLNAIDFNFCLKGDENDLLGPLEINYSPFLTYKQSSASQHSDKIEMLHLSGQNVDNLQNGSSILSETSLSDVLHVQNIEKDMRQIKEQKDYLEELVRLRDRQLQEAQMRIENMNIQWQLGERNHEQERLILEECILELQKELAKQQKLNDSLKAQVSTLKHDRQQAETRNSLKFQRNKEVEKSGTQEDMDAVWHRSDFPEALSALPPAVALHNENVDPYVAERSRIPGGPRSQNQEPPETEALQGTRPSLSTNETIQSQCKDNIEEYGTESSTFNSKDDQNKPSKHHRQLQEQEHIPRTTTRGFFYNLGVRKLFPQTVNPVNSMELSIKDQVAYNKMQYISASTDMPESNFVAQQTDDTLCQGQGISVNTKELTTDDFNISVVGLTQPEKSVPCDKNFGPVECVTEELTTGFMANTSELDSLTLAEEHFQVVASNDSNDAGTGDDEVAEVDVVESEAVSHQ